MRLIAIDPGASGAIVWEDSDGVLHADNMPEDYTALVDTLRDIATQSGECYAVVEKTGTYVPGNSGPAAATFARHCGHIEAAVYAVGIPADYVAPTVWQRQFNLPKDKKARKHAIKVSMAAKYPHLKVTLKNADALGIYTFAKSARK